MFWKPIKEESKYMFIIVCESKGILLSPLPIPFPKKKPENK